MLSLTSSPDATSRSPTRSSPASSGRSTIGCCGPARSCRRSAASPTATRSAASRWSRPMIAWSRWAICTRAAAPASIPRRRRAERVAAGAVRQPQAQRAAGLAHPPTARGGREHHPCRRPVAAQFLARRSRHPPEPQRAGAQERRLSARIRQSVRLSAAARAPCADARRTRRRRPVRPDPADARYQPGARARHPLSAQARRRGAGRRSRLLQHVRQSAAARRRDAGGAAQSAMGRTSRRSKSSPPRTGRRSTSPSR